MDKWVIHEPIAKKCEALQKNQILVLEVLELENLAVERRENTKKPILNMDLLIPLSTACSAHNV
jgi:hypothetical protein